MGNKYYLKAACTYKADGDITDAVRKLGSHLLTAVNEAEVSNTAESKISMLTGMFEITHENDSKTIRVIEDDEFCFPNRELTTDEMKLILIQIIKYSSREIYKKLMPNDQLAAKIADSVIIEKFYECDFDYLIKNLFCEIGGMARLGLTKNSAMLGLDKSRD